MAETAAAVPPPTVSFLGQAGIESAERRARRCARPIRLRGSRDLVNTTTGEVRTLYSSADELDGHTYVRCGNRRASVCPTCSHEYKGDAWHLLMCGLAGGKGVPEAVRDRPCTFVTLTAPSFGPVHGLRATGPCRARRDRPVCAHGRPLWCTKRHIESDRLVGQPLCGECYDYTAHVLWQWHAPELWRRFTIALQRDLAKRVGLKVTRFRERCRISYSKVVEFQARGIIHIHAPIRLDGPLGPDGEPCRLDLHAGDLEAAVTAAATAVYVDTAPLVTGPALRLRWGRQIDTRTISDTADRESSRSSRGVHPEQVAAYLAKYLTKTTEDFGLSSAVRSAQHARMMGATPHVVRIVETALRLARETPDFARLSERLSTLGYRGHPITKSRHYSVTFGQIRRSRRLFHSRPAALAPDADIREILDEEPPEGYEVVSSFVYAGRGYLAFHEVVEAVRSAALARAR